MDTLVSTSSIICMFISAALSILLPIGAVVYLAVKKKLSLKSTLWGVLLFVVFAFGLEQLLHLLVLGTSGTSYVATHPYIYALYGGLAAGVFEETARLIGFKWLIRVKEDESAYTGISYGLGHGGIEAISLGGVAMISSLIISFTVNAGTAPAAQARIANQLIAAQPYMFLIPGVERVFAMIIQIALSLIVLKAVISKKWWLFALAIFLHAFVDFPAALYQWGILPNILLIELFVALIAALYVFIAYKVFTGGRKSSPDIA
jgi:uncharacterized membrane protein YhfC